MPENDKYILPTIIIKEVNPILEHKGIILASEIIGTLPSCNQESIRLIENKGWIHELEKYIGVEMECVLEVTQGRLWRPTLRFTPENLYAAAYLWTQQPYVFFPELVNIIDNSEELDMGEEFIDAFDKTAQETFANWGLSGFGLDYGDSKPMIQTIAGVFILNEYEFEETIDNLSLFQKFHIDIKEVHLRGIRPYIPPEDIEEEPELTEAQKAEKARRAAQQERSRIAHEQMQERIRKRRESGEGPGFSVV